MKHFGILSLLVLLTVSCNAQWGKKVKGNGNYTTIERNTGDYESVTLAGWFDVQLVSGSEGTITLEGEENLLEHVITEVRNGDLVIKVEKGLQLRPSTWGKGITVTVPIESIDGVTMSGSGDIEGKTTIKTKSFKTTLSGSGDINLDIEAESVSTTLSGSGDIDLTGSTEEFYVTVSGSGDVDAYGLKAAFAEVKVSGSANVNLTATKELKARVSGSGDINYKGNPKKVDTKSAGSGDISKA